jgi:hypothetical protein
MLLDTIDVLRVSIAESFTLRSKLPKIKDRFSEDLYKILLVSFRLYKIICNDFENCILEKSSPEIFKKVIERNNNLYKSIMKEIKISLNDKKSYIIFRRLSEFLISNVLHTLTSLVNESYHNGDRKYYIVTGKDELLNTYLSIISILYGIIFIKQNNKFIFFCQPFYDKSPSIYNILAELCNYYLDKEIKIVISYRFYDDEITSKEKFNKIRYTFFVKDLTKKFKPLYIACKKFYSEFNEIDNLIFDDKMDEIKDL